MTRVFVPTFGEYQAVAMQTASIYPRTRVTWDCETRLETIPVYPALAALGEAGELCDKIVDGGREQLPYLKELGDVLWYITAAAVELRLSDPGHELGALLNHWRFSSKTTFSNWATYQSQHDPNAGVEALRLVAYLGRYSERIKKCWRESTALDVGACVLDLERALTQIHHLALCFYSNIGEVAQANADKLASRRARGTLLGSGDNR